VNNGVTTVSSIIVCMNEVKANIVKVVGGSTTVRNDNLLPLNELFADLRVQIIRSSAELLLHSLPSLP
jgi:hypothetical protein